MQKRGFLLLILTFFILWIPRSGLCQPAMKVGALVPFAGRWGDLGRECARGLQDGARWINQQGGISGRRLEILVIEDTFQVAETVAAYRKLNEIDRILVLYAYSAETAINLQSHIHFNRIATFVSFLPSPLTYPSKYPYFFSTSPTPLDLSKIGLKFIAENSGIKARKPRVLFVGSSDYLDRHFLEEAKSEAYRLGLDIGPDVLFSDFSPLKETPSGDKTEKPGMKVLAPVVQHNPDFVYLSLTPKEALSVLQEAKDVGWKARWMIHGKGFDETLGPFEGVLGTQPFSPFGADVPGMIAIKEAHQRWHPLDVHTVSFVEGWVTAQVIAEALGRSLPEEQLSREGVRSSLEKFHNVVLGGLVPPITITPQDHRPSVESRIFVVKEGKLVPQTTFISLERERKKLP
jgi:branched-chain amino acid transport system substrate-binding protein